MSEATNVRTAGFDNFAPIMTEDDFALDVVVGELPKGLTGTLYRNGPNPRFAARDNNHHWFLGDGMVHAFRIRDGQVHYRNRWMRTPRWLSEDREREALFGSWGNPGTTHPSVLGHDDGVANTSISIHAGKIMALEEAHKPFVFDPETLNPRGYEAFGGKFDGPFTAHPKFDPVTGELVFFGYSAGEPLSSDIIYGTVDRSGALQRNLRFKSPYCSMMHDFIVTPNHVIFPMLPLTGDKSRAMRGGPAYAWEPAKGAFLGIMNRNSPSDPIRWIETDACYVFHVVNAWEVDDHIVADVMQYDTAPLFPDVDGNRIAQSYAKLTRWTINPNGASGSVARTYLDDLSGEFPRFDDRVAGSAYCHTWYSGHFVPQPGFEFDTIVHRDLRSDHRHLWRLPPGDVVSEPIFAPRSSECSEADGWLLAVVYRRKEDHSQLVILEALNIGSGPVAVADVPRRVPFGFHGAWLPSRQ
jgi:carotenoid cleavage dioxygenase-like enzyme